jgi:cellulose synthase operon protein C
MEISLVNGRNNALLAAAIVATLALAGCSRNDAASYLASAQAYAAKGDYKAAAIEAKNALQKNPDNGDARVLLASGLLAQGDAAGAEAEVRKAISLHVPDDRTYPLLARTLAAQGEFDKLASELGDRDLRTAAARADVDGWIAIGALAQGDNDRARRLAGVLLADDPGNPRALLILAQTEAQRGDAAAARASIDKALASSPNNIDAILMKAQIDIGEGKRDDATALLDDAIRAHSDSIAARYMRLALAVTGGKLDDAKAQLAKMKEIRPKELRTVYGDALVAFASGDYQQARDAVQQVQASRPDDLAALYLSGLVDYQLGIFSTAENSLRRVVAKTPDNIGARRALAMVYLRTGRGPQALDTLQPALRSAPDNPLLLRTAGEAYLAAGDAVQAARAYERANSVDRNDIGSKVRLAEVRFAGGDTARAFRDLEQLAADDASSAQADVALFFAHLRKREYDKALATADGIAKKQPKSALPYDLRGLVALAKRDLPTARKAFEKALEVEPEHFAAAYNLATIDIQEGRPQAARERYERMLKSYGRSEQLLLGYAQVLAVTGAAPDDMRSALERAVANNPTSIRARVARIEFDLRRRDSKSALAAAQAALSAVPDDPQLLSVLGAAQVMAGDLNQAINTFRRLAQLQTQNPVPLLQLAEAQAAANEFPAAIESERKAIALKPDLAPAWALLARTYIASGHADTALAEAKKLQREQPKNVLGFALEGEIQAAQKKWPDAAAAYRDALARLPNAQIAARYYTTLQAAGKGGEAKAMAAKWMNEHPDEAALPAVLAEQDLSQGRVDDAIAAYQRVLKIDPDNVIALNNLGWTLTEKKDPKGLEYAERAHRLAPFNAGVLDTLGFAYTNNGDPKRGVQLLRMASTMMPSRGEYRLHLAQALADSGDKAAARVEAEPLTKLEKNAPLRAQAEKLLSTLGP